jgi:hypothetical protein
MFSGIETRWVPRAHMSGISGGRSADASQPSTPPVSDWIHLSRGARRGSPAGGRHDSSPSARASTSSGGFSRGGTATNST